MRYTLRFFLVLICSCAAYPQERPCSPADQASIHQIAELWKEGYNQGNATKVAALYADDAFYLTQHFITGMVAGRPQIQAYVQRGVDAKYHIDSIQNLTSVCSGDFAYAITRYESTNAGQKAFGVNLVVLRKKARHWLIVAHESAVPDPATAIRTLDASVSK
jgi:uncharacterized protein (TIGR02246 family)